MLVRDVMKTTVITVPHTATYEDVVLIIQQNQITGTPVLDDTGTLIGMISEKDLFRVLFPYYDSYYKQPESYTDFEKREEKILEIKHDPITKFMQKEVITTTPDVPIMKIGGLMLAKGIHSIPVVDADKKLLAIVDRPDIYRTIFKQHLQLEA